ncbi:MAG: hemolysin III family protein [Saprospiraceae bacterium]|nr:hemolysin III family protein [Saprospiraceae bacterium]
MKAKIIKDRSGGVNWVHCCWLFSSLLCLFMDSKYYLLPVGTDRREVANFYTHLTGVILSMIGLPFLIAHISKSGLPVFGFWVFGISSIVLYASSTLYHGVQRPKLKFQLEKVDHICIYFLIAGTNTPFAQLYLDTPYREYFLFSLWGLVLLGTLYKLFFFGRWKIFSVLFYLFLGWMAALVMPIMLEQMPISSFWWIVIGGGSYSIGVIFYVWKKMTYHHAIWHLFVLGGTAGHYIALWQTTS